MFAYIDPNSGSLIIQAMIAGAVALPFFFRRQIARLTGMFRRDKQVEEVATAEAHSASDAQ
jgi:hypothetical protein